jgi:hypothetical protein
VHHGLALQDTREPDPRRGTSGSVAGVQRLILTLVAVAILWSALIGGKSSEAQPRWWRGNTHTHTLWSDGDAAPELAVDWYRARGYDFLVLTDHNVLQQGERWFPVSEDGSRRLKPGELADLESRFPGQVQVRDGERGREMLLVTLPELKRRFERAGKFLLVPGEEVTANWSSGERNYPVHINAVGIRGVIPPRDGASVAELVNSTLDAIEAHGREHDVPVLAHINHPNFGWGMTWEDLAAMGADRFFEVYNGHRSVRNQGDKTHPSTETMWDLANVRRLTELDLPLLYAVATDDAHNYHGVMTATTGRGWVQVWCAELADGALIEAMKAGDFYASSGVELARVSRGPGRYLVEVKPEQGVLYTTRFIGVRKGEDGSPGAPEVLEQTTKSPCTYTYDGSELFVRAVVTSSKPHPNPYTAGDLEMAWTQPVAVSGR